MLLLLSLLCATTTVTALTGCDQGSEFCPDGQAICQNHDFYSNDKDRLQCMENQAWGLACRDDSACMHSGCTKEEIARRAGYTCSGFPYYNGGYPLSDIMEDDEFERYECLSEAPNATHCEQHDSFEDSEDEFELGECGCREVAHGLNGSAWCASWHCIQREHRKCRDDESGRPNGERPIRCCRRDDKNRERCEDTFKEREFIDGWCFEDNGRYCTRWNQTEYDEHNRHFVEHETYRCTRASSNGRYCSAWEGVIRSEEEFEFSTCECAVGRANYCYKWTCDEVGYSYFYPNMFLSFAMYVFSLVCAFAFILFFFEKSNNGFCIFLWAMFGFSIVLLIMTAWLCGVLCVIIHGSLALITLLCLCCCAVAGSCMPNMSL